MGSQTLIGVDLGGTKVLAGKVGDGKVVASSKRLVPAEGTVGQVLDVIFETIDDQIDDTTRGIGIGVPSIVDVETGIVYDVQNIPSWQEVHLGDIMRERYGLEVQINNDANCFAVGERFFGHARNVKDFVALIVGTGVATGLYLNGRLYAGKNCGAGEIGMIPYLDHHLEYYCSGQFFETVHQTSGRELEEQAKGGDVRALEIFEEFGSHLGNVINTILYAYDPELIIIGGSVSKAYKFYEKAMLDVVGSNVYGSVKAGLRIEISSNPDIAVLGAAALCMKENLN